jgi:hypothetical protein
MVQKVFTNIKTVIPVHPHVHQVTDVIVGGMVNVRGSAPAVFLLFKPKLCVSKRIALLCVNES